MAGSDRRSSARSTRSSGARAPGRGLRRAAARDRRPAALHQGGAHDLRAASDAVRRPHPDARAAAGRRPGGAARGAGLSRAKVAYLRSLAEHVIDGELELDRLDELSDEEVAAELTAVKGLGQWTADMFLIFHLAGPTSCPSATWASARAVQIAYGLDELPGARPSSSGSREPWRPYRSLAWLYLWRSLDNAPVSRSAWTSPARSRSSPAAQAASGARRAALAERGRAGRRRRRRRAAAASGSPAGRRALRPTGVPTSSATRDGRGRARALRRARPRLPQCRRRRAAAGVGEDFDLGALPPRDGRQPRRRRVRHARGAARAARSAAAGAIVATASLAGLTGVPTTRSTPPTSTRSSASRARSGRRSGRRHPRQRRLPGLRRVGDHRPDPRGDLQASGVPIIPAEAVADDRPAAVRTTT